MYIIIIIMCVCKYVCVTYSYIKLRVCITQVTPNFFKGQVLITMSDNWFISPFAAPLKFF